MAGAWLGASPVCLGGRASPRSRRLRALGLGSLGAGLASAPALRRRGARAATSSEGGDRRSGEAKKTMGRPAEGGVSVGDSMMAGAFAGMLGRVAVAPLDVIKIRMQVQVEPVGGGGTLGAGKYQGIDGVGSIEDITERLTGAIGA